MPSVSKGIRGGVPGGCGTDAQGADNNIVPGKHRKGWSLDASYTYGSFNTHKSYVDFSYISESGFSFEINAFQNYSDTNYGVRAVLWTEKRK